MNLKSRGALHSAQCPLVIAPYGPGALKAVTKAPIRRGRAATGNTVDIVAAPEGATRRVLKPNR